MSPASRGRKKRSRSTGQRVVRQVVAGPATCHCPDCSGERLEPLDLVADLLDDGNPLLEVEEAVEAEMFAAGLLAMGHLAGAGFAEAVASVIVPELERTATPAALAVLHAIALVDDGPAAAEAVARLEPAGLAAPRWLAEARMPVTPGVYRRFAEPSGQTSSVLIGTFERAGRADGFAVNVDDSDCHAAVDVVLFPGEALDQVLATIEGSAREHELPITGVHLDPAEFRWQVERALSARAAHDDDLAPDEIAAEYEDGDEPGYHHVAMLLRARVRTLPEPSRPAAEHLDDEIELFTRIATEASPRRRAPRAKLPAKRKKSDGPAPIFQLKVSLRDAKPPIWRRLEVPADTGLADLHTIIQIAFDWDDSHLHAFETGYGTFGLADPELGHQAERPVTLEQVAAGAGGRIRYTYDFGDGWEHDILVEKVLERGSEQYPRCTGGRRAAPPDDCGGIWGYQRLIEILDDAAHPEHAEMREWLGLDQTDEFRPARFDAAEVTRSLAAGFKR
ncbi:plasmid pRiA4b ORF-3 family protein [Actinoplanes flavus]|uniref:Plasmid pRiA4b ORF-3 family protein n=1 Tax=Actinoplanes flavus TaxID=2820290 RepID=A0ABS3UXA0_9ACTN|nr:plasmid pRiA4b ORF-3 family protein [Actinoplanes flavus]MBO3743207.1 plasmid pRiA4b ORF-3 family protein [Actinoplanes flavus]